MRAAGEGVRCSHKRGPFTNPHVPDPPGQSPGSPWAALGKLECRPPSAVKASPGYQPPAGSTAPLCGDGKIESREACDGSKRLRKSCKELGFSGGRLGCDACRADVGRCTTCASTMACSVEELPAGQVITAFAERRGQTAMLWTHGGGSSACRSVRFVPLDDSLALGPAVEIAAQPILRSLALTPTKTGWLAVLQTGFIPNTIALQPDGKPRGDLRRIPTFGDSVLFGDAAHSVHLLYVWPDHDRGNPIEVHLLDDDGEPIGDPIIPWDGRSTPRFTPPAATLTEDGFALARSDIGFDDERVASIVEISRTGEVLGRTLVEGQGQPVRLDRTRDGWRVITYDTQRYWQLDVSGGKTDRKVLAEPSPEPGTTRRYFIRDFASEGDQTAIALAVEGYAELDLLTIEDGVVGKPVLVRHDGLDSAATVDILGGRPVVSWAAPRFREPTPDRKGPQFQRAAPGSMLLHLARPR